MSGRATPESWLPNPWVALQCRPHLRMERAGIPEPARYIHDRGAIVVRKGLLLEEERRHLFHELVHADRGDEMCYSTGPVERAVEHAAVRWAMPLSVLERTLPQAQDWEEAAGLVKLPEEWLRYRWKITDRDERAYLISLAQEAREAF